MKWEKSNTYHSTTIDMIKDLDFKSLNHSCEGYEKYRNGQTLELGYKPDYVLKRGNEYIILESENSSSRKTFVGGMIKAAHFLTGEKHGKLIFVIVAKKNTSASSIAKHLQKYFDWISINTNLKEIYVIESTAYYLDKKVLNLDCSDFKNTAHLISASQST